jgi:two-component system phosphate regulon sensor histidine kinase PhoR
MDTLSAISLLINGLTLALAFGFLLIILWNDPNKELNQFFAAFLFLVLLWNMGALIAQSVALIDTRSPLLRPAVGLMESGFIGSSVALYSLVASLVRVGTRRFRALALSAMLLVLTLRLLLILNDAPILFEMPTGGALINRAQPLQASFFMLFGGASLYLLWRYRRKVRSNSMIAGIVIFVAGQSLGFANPALQTFSLSLIICAAGSLIMGFALLRREVFRPLAERNSQVEAIRKVSDAIAGQTAIERVLDQISVQVSGLLGADGVAIWLRDGDALSIATIYNLPPQYLNTYVLLGEGIAGTAARTRQSIRLDDYSREWRGREDFPQAKAMFGSVICTPLMYAHESIGAVMVIAGRQGRLFEREDVYTLELLGAQASVAISHSQLFEEQRALTRQVESARGQLETVLTSTQSPVVAVDRHFRLMFANPAARTLFNLPVDANIPMHQLLPAAAFPPNGFVAMRSLRRARTYNYEIEYEDRVYSCHLAQFGRPRIAGWVAVLTDITELKELDRLKSEMVRMTSHDLKNPLQAAMANLELLRDDVQDLANPEVAESLTSIERQLERMFRIISGILDMERLKSEVSHVEQTHPSRIIEMAMHDMRDFATEKQVRLEAETAPNVIPLPCDADQLTRALINLIENAIKFSPAGGLVSIRAERDGDSMLFSVRDTGVGIPADVQPHVFDRFYRGKQKGVEHVSGSGLGLSLVKAVVDNHRGKVWLDSRVGQGTTFYMALPMATTSVPVVEVTKVQSHD